MAGPGLSIYDARDIDLMVTLAGTGAMGSTSREIAEALGFGEDGVRHVGIRFAWMRRFGMLAYDEKLHYWSLTRGGERVVESQLKAAQARTIEAIPDDALVNVMSHVTSRYRLGDPMVAQLLRREFMFGTQRR